MTTTIPINQARQHLGEIIEEAFYLGKPFIVKRGNKPMAVIFGQHEFDRVIKLAEQYDPGLADTFAIMSNPEAQKVIDQGEKDMQNGDIVPFDTSLLSK